MLGMGMLTFSACIKDNGNYDYLEGNPVTINLGATAFRPMIDEPFVIEPIRTYRVPGKTANDYYHEWMVTDEVVSTDSTLVYVGTTNGTFRLVYSMIDKETGIRSFSSGATQLVVSSPYQTGWTILYEKAGESELAHTRWDAPSEKYVDYIDIYKAKHDGESLGSAPMRLKNYPMSGTWSLVVVQQGGQGPIEMNGATMEKALETRNAFVGGAPANLAPVNIGAYAAAHVMHNADGNVYGRFFSSSPAPIPFSMPWLNVPLTVGKGMKIAHMWDTHGQNVMMNFMYDELNNRILFANFSTANATGGYVNIDTLPAPVASRPYPVGFVNLNHMGDWEYVWGNAFNDAPNTGNAGIITDGVVLMRRPGETDIFMQSFEMRSVNRVYSHTPKVRMPFTGANFVNDQSVYVAIKSNNYIFFSGGAANEELYYFDMQSGVTKLHSNLGGRITALQQSDNSQELAVGLENGTFLLFGIGNVDLNSGNTTPKHRIAGLGRVADITVRNGLMR